MITTAMPEPRALTELALVELNESLREASDPDDFLGRADAIVCKRESQLPLAVSLGTPDPLASEGSRGIDVKNGPLVHEYLGELERANAADARLWTYLAFATYRTYMQARWPLVASTSSPDAWRRRVRDRWLLLAGQVTRGSLVRHGIARLWWVTHLTWVPDAQEGIAAGDPYAYTREVLRNEDRINAIFDREVGAIESVRLAVLDHAAANPAEATDKYLQHIMKALTLVHGYRDLGALSKDAIFELVEAAAGRVAA